MFPVTPYHIGRQRRKLTAGEDLTDTLGESLISFHPVGNTQAYPGVAEHHVKEALDAV